MNSDLDESASSVNIYKQNISALDVGRGIFKRESQVIVGMIDSGAGAGHMGDVESMRCAICDVNTDHH